MKKKLALILALAMVFAIALTACGGKDDDSATSDTPSNTNTDTPDDGNEPAGDEDDNEGGVTEGDPIVIGHIVDKTGVESLTGNEAAQAMEFAAKYFNENLGGINGHPIEIKEEDSQSNAQTAADVAKKLVEQENVIAVLGPTQIGHKQNVMSYMKDAGVPLLMYNPTPAGLVAGSEYAISGGGGTAQFPTVMADFMYNTLGYERIYTLTMNNAGGQSYMNPLIENFTALGGTVIKDQWYDVPCADFTPYFSTMTEQADALVAWASGSDAINLWQTWYNAGTYEKMPIVASMHGGFTDYYIPQEIANSNPDIAEKMIGTYAPMMYTYTIDSPENKAFLEAWEAEMGSIPGGTNLPGACYQALLTLKTAVENNDGDTSPETLYQAIQDTDITGPEGHQNFSDGRAATKDIHVVQLVQLEDGSFNYEIVDTGDAYNDVPPTGLVVEAE